MSSSRSPLGHGCLITKGEKHVFQGQRKTKSNKSGTSLTCCGFHEFHSLLHGNYNKCCLAAVFPT